MDRPWGHKESDTTEQLTQQRIYIYIHIRICVCIYIVSNQFRLCFAKQLNQDKILQYNDL